MDRSTVTSHQPKGTTQRKSKPKSKDLQVLHELAVEQDWEERKKRLGLK